MQGDNRLPAGQIGDFAGPPSHGHTHAKTDRLAKGLLGAEAGCEKAHTPVRPAFRATTPNPELLLAQNPCSESIPVTLETVPDSSNVTNIGAYSKNHFFQVNQQVLARPLLAPGPPKRDTSKIVFHGLLVTHFQSIGNQGMADRHFAQTWYR